MSGIFGLFDPTGQVDIQAGTNQMARAMSYGKWHNPEFFVDTASGGGLGRIGIGILNRDPQPVWNDTKTLAVVIAGEIYNKPVSGDAQSLTDEHYVLALYQRYGEQFLADLEGVFIFAIWDLSQKRLVIANDRLGLYPLYYAHTGRFLCFAPEMKGILCHDKVQRTLDMVALAEYLRFQHLLGTRTFFEQIHLFPGATVLTYDLASGQMKMQTYWSFDDIPFLPEITFNEAVEETGRLLRQAVRKRSEDELRTGVFLSGGLDSRTLAGLVERRPLPTLTYGHKNSRDVYYAGKIAKTIGSEHHWFDYPDGSWVLTHVNQHLEITEGFHSWIHMHSINVLEDARRLMDVNLTGWDGGTVMGHPEDITPYLIAPVNDETLIVHLFNLFHQKYTWPSITEAEEAGIYSESLRPQMIGLAQDSFRTEFHPYLHLRKDIRAGLFFISNHCMRLTHNMVTMYRSSIEVRFPFFDQALFNFIYSIPSELRAHRKLYYGVIDRETPSLSRIPYDHDEFLPTNQNLRRNIHSLGIKVKRRINHVVPHFFPDRVTLYADYEDYLRKDLRKWGEDLLFDRRTSERGIFNIGFLKALYERHLHGNEEWTIGKIAPVMTYEMFLRRYLD